jgi:hypothetical protein
MVWLCSSSSRRRRLDVQYAKTLNLTADRMSDVVEYLKTL